MARPTKRPPAPARQQLRAALYLRVSTEDQVEAFGLDVQRAQCSAMAAAKGWTLDAAQHVYADEGISGTKDETGRPQLAALLAAIDAGEIDAVIIKALNRLGRRTMIVLELVERITAAGCQLVSCDESLDTSTPAGMFVVQMFAALAELDHRNIVKRLTDGRNARFARDGERGGPLPFGYVRAVGEGIAIDGQAADLVRLAFERRAAGDTLRAIAAQLGEHGPGPRGGAWHPTAVRQILNNEPTYRGQRGPGGAPWPAILPPAATSAPPPPAPPAPPAAAAPRPVTHFPPDTPRAAARYDYQPLPQRAPDPPPARRRKGKADPPPAPIAAEDEPLLAWIESTEWGGRDGRDVLDLAWLLRLLSYRYSYDSIQARLGWPYGRVASHLALLRAPADVRAAWAATPIAAEDRAQLAAVGDGVPPVARAATLAPLLARYPAEALARELGVPDERLIAWAAWGWLPSDAALALDELAALP